MYLQLYYTMQNSVKMLLKRNFFFFLLLVFKKWRFWSVSTVLLYFCDNRCLDDLRSKSWVLCTCGGMCVVNMCLCAFSYWLETSVFIEVLETEIIFFKE